MKRNGKGRRQVQALQNPGVGASDGEAVRGGAGGVPGMPSIAAGGVPGGPTIGGGVPGGPTLGAGGVPGRGIDRFGAGGVPG